MRNPWTGLGSSPPYVTMLRDGVVAERSPYAPWGLIFDWARLIDAGARPVLYLSSDEMERTDDLAIRLRNRRVRYDPGHSDWLHEREWRICYRPVHSPYLELDRGLVVSVIVGKRGWVPPPAIIERRTFHVADGAMVASGSSMRIRYSAAADHLARWWWGGEDLVEDGVFDIREQMLEDQLRPNPYRWMHLARKR